MKKYQIVISDRLREFLLNTFDTVNSSDYAYSADLEENDLAGEISSILRDARPWPDPEINNDSFAADMRPDEMRSWSGDDDDMPF